MRTLKVTTGPEEGRQLEIEGEVVLGREQVDLVVPDTEISRRHAVVREVERGVEIEDLGSMNGTFVNGERISSPVTLTSSGALRVGTTEMEIEVALPTDVTRASPIPSPDVTVARNVPDVTAVRTTPPPTPTGPPPGVQPPPGVEPRAGGPPPGVQLPPGGPPPGFGPPGGPPTGLRGLLMRAFMKIPPLRKLAPKLMTMPAPLRMIVMLLVLLVIVGVPVALVVLLLL